MTKIHSDEMSRQELEASLTQAYPVVFNRISGRFKDPQLAEEVSVDSMTQAFEKWRDDPGYFQTHDLTAWSSRLASWRALDRLRERTRFRPLPEEALDKEELPSTSTVQPRQENASDSRVRDWEITWNCLQQLDQEDRGILSGYYYDGLTDQELGEELFGTLSSTQANGLKVWRRRQRAHARLRELLIEGGIDPAEWSSPGGQAV
jgi:DNA-directed RNA polymerase specialized sigma24 family protein